MTRTIEVVQMTVGGPITPSVLKIDTIFFGITLE